MKKTILIFALGICFSCKAQQPILEDLSGREDLNYILALINPEKTTRTVLYNLGLYITFYEILDPKATPKNYSDGDDVLSSVLISAISDSGYNKNSKLYKIRGIELPKILEIKESNYPDFYVKIEFGSYLKQREVKTFEFKGVE